MIANNKRIIPKNVCICVYGLNIQFNLLIYACGYANARIYDMSNVHAANTFIQIVSVSC